MPNLNGPAVHPPVTFIQLLVVVPPFKWTLNIHLPGSITVFQVVQHLSEYLQGYENAYDLQKSKVQIPSGYNHPPQLREQNHPNGFHSGNRRIDLLGRNRRFRGLSPGPGPNCAWVVHLLDRWYTLNASTWTSTILKLTSSSNAQHLTRAQSPLNSLTSHLACVV